MRGSSILEESLQRREASSSYYRVVRDWQRENSMQLGAPMEERASILPSSPSKKKCGHSLFDSVFRKKQLLLFYLEGGCHSRDVSVSLDLHDPPLDTKKYREWKPIGGFKVRGVTLTFPGNSTEEAPVGWRNLGRNDFDVENGFWKSLSRGRMS